MPLPETLNFANEDEKIALMEKYSQEPDANPDEINRIMDAPVATPDPEPVDPDIEEVPMDEGTPAPQEEGTPAPESAPAPAPAPASTETQAAEAAMNRNWAIREEDIPKDTYFDKASGKVRPFITHKDPKDVFKTLIHGQKRIHYLEDVLLPQERDAAVAQARAQFDAEIARLKAENEALKKAPQTAAPAPAPAPQTAPGATPAAPAGETAAKFAAAMEALKGIDPNDSIENTDKLHAALMASMEHINGLTAAMKQPQDNPGVQALQAKFDKYERERQTEAQRQEALVRQNEAKQNWQKACSLVDSFAQTNPDFRTEYGNVDQTFENMTRDAVTFHTQLAGLLFNKHPNQVSNQEQMAASEAWLRGDDKLVQATQQYGFQEPKNYRAWVELDQVDAMRTGMFRDPASKAWQQLSDPVTKKPVHLGDMDTAWGRYLDVSGRRAAKTAAMLKQQQESLAGAISRRDTGIVSMDSNQLRSDGSGADITEQQALDIMDSVDPVYAQNQYLRGNKEPLERVNRAFARLGMEPIEAPEAYEPMVAARR